MSSTQTPIPIPKGQPRSPADAEALARFSQRMAVPIVLSAVLPLLLLPGGAHRWVEAAVFIAAWLVFLADLIERKRLLVDYLGTWIGRFDLFVVVVTAPWFLIVGPGVGKFVVLIRLARVARLVMAASSSSVPTSPTTPSTRRTPGSRPSATRSGGRS